VDTDSTIVDTHSDLTQNLSTIASESLSTINRNHCPRSFGMTVHDASEYALGCAKAPEAVAAFEKAVGFSRDPVNLGYLGYAYGLAGRRDATLNILEEMVKGSSVADLPQTSLAYLYIGLGDFDRAFESLDRCMEQRDGRLFWFPATVFSEAFRADKRYGLLLERMKTAVRA